MADVRLIDANALMKAIGKIPQLRGITYGRIKKAVEESPEIDAVPVLHAEFKLTGYNEAWGTWGDCQNCGHSNMVGSKYCNGCGEKLELIT